MPFNGAGTFTSLGAPTFPAVSGDFILASYFNATMNDVFSGLSGVLPRDGQAAMAANLPMGGFKVTGLGIATATNDALAYGQAAAVLAGLTVNTTFAMTGTMTAVAGTLDLTGATSVTVPLQAVSDDSNKAASTAFVQDFFLTMPSGTLPSMTGKSLYNLRVNAGETGVEWAAIPAPTILRSTRTSNTILAVADQGKLIDVTSGTFSQTLTAAATLGSGWFVYLKNSGTGVVTLDPNGAELIDGATTLAVPAGSECVIQCTGTAFVTFFRTVLVPYSYQNIFAATSGALTAVSAFETIETSQPSVGLGSIGIKQIIFGNSLFLAAGISGSPTNIATSPDGTTWTLRAMGAADNWALGTNGTDKFIACAGSATQIKKSTDGTTWSAGTALPAAALATYAKPAFVGDTALILSNTASTAYWSADNAATWTSATLPSTVNAAGWLFSVGGLFWYHETAGTAWTSATGATGSWTSRAIGIAPTTVYQDTDGSLWACASGALGWYRSTDGINWTAQTSLGIAFGSSTATQPMYNVNGTYVTFNSTFGLSATYHNGLWRQRYSSSITNVTAQTTCAKNTGGTIFMFPSTLTVGTVKVIDTTSTTLSQALFKS